MAQSITGDPSFGASGLPAAAAEQRSSDHLVQFYTEDDLLLQTLQRYVGGALGSGDSAIVISPEPHRRELAKRLKWCGVDLQLAQNAGRYHEFDAATVLSTLGAGITPEAFRERLEEPLIRAGKLSCFDHSHIMVFGEIVGLMWERNRHEDAVALEELWNRSMARQRFSLLCAYPVRSISALHLKPFSEVCIAHAGAVSHDSHVALTSGPQRRFPAVGEEPDAQKWRPLYQSAIWETDRQRAFRKVEMAEAAILSQIEATGTSSSPNKQQELIDALASLFILKKQKLGFE